MSIRARNEQRNEITAWAPGYTVDTPETRSWSPTEKASNDEREALLVRPYPTGNAICQCTTPEEATWIAERLNKVPGLVSHNDWLANINREKDSEINGLNTRIEQQIAAMERMAGDLFKLRGRHADMVSSAIKVSAGSEFVLALIAVVAFVIWVMQ
jgi:hypothetical protein